MTFIFHPFHPSNIMLAVCLTHKALASSKLHIARFNWSNEVLTETLYCSLEEAQT